jgi:hypothetical protein
MTELPNQPTAPRAPFHAAVFVSDLGESSLGALSRWNPRFESPTLPLHSHQGREPLRVEVRRVRTDPACPFNVSVERAFDVQFIRPNQDNRWHHVGFWSSDLEGDAGRLEEHGYIRDAWSESEDGRLDTFVYLMSPQGLRVELTQDGHEHWTDWWYGAHAAAVAEDVAQGMTEDEVQGRRLHHVGAVLSDPEAEAHALEAALGIQWNRASEAEAVAFEADRKRTVMTRVMTSTGTPPLTFVHRGWRGDRFPGYEDGWDHVAFVSDQLDDDVSALERLGYVRTAYWERGFTEAGTAMLLSAPEGTRVMLVENSGID